MAISSRRASPLPRLPKLAPVPVIGRGAARGPCRAVLGVPHTPNPLSWAVTDDAEADRGVGGGSGFTGCDAGHASGRGYRAAAARNGQRPARAGDR
jgi:hypothetical protein